MKAGIVEIERFGVHGDVVSFDQATAMIAMVGGVFGGNVQQSAFLKEVTELVQSDKTAPFGHWILGADDEGKWFGKKIETAP